MPPARSSRRSWSPTFIAGIETAADAPLPGEEPTQLWRPRAVGRLIDAPACVTTLEVHRRPSVLAVEPRAVLAIAAAGARGQRCCGASTRARAADRRGTATGVATKVFTLTATNEDPLAALDSSREIGCVVVDVPTGYFGTDSFRYRRAAS